MATVDALSTAEKFAPHVPPRKDVEDWGREARRRIITEIRARGLVEPAWEIEEDDFIVPSPEGSTRSIWPVQPCSVPPQKNDGTN